MVIKELESVYAVYQFKSFAEAAFQTSFSTSAISKHVNHVEKELGCKLFNRKTYRQSKLLTAEGERLMPYIIEVNKLVQLMNNVAQEMREESSALHIGVIETMQGSIIDRLWPGFPYSARISQSIPPICT